MGEEGPELINLPKGSKVLNASKTNDILNSPIKASTKYSNSGIKNENIYSEKVFENKVTTPSYQKIEYSKDNNSNDKKDKSYTVTIEGSKYEFNFTGPINNFADIKDKLEKWMDRREKRTDQKLRALLGGA